MRPFLLKILLLIFIFASCDEEGLPENLLDPTAGDYDGPETTITSSLVSTIITNSMSFSYSGNELVVEYSHRLDYDMVESDWSSWTTDTTITYNYLDEGNYTFYVKGRYSEQDEDPTPSEHSFSVDAVSASSIRIFPQSVDATANAVFDIEVYTEEINNLSLAQIELEYNNEHMGVYSIQKGNLLNSFPGSEIFIDQETSSNTILITIGVGGSSGSGLNGTGSLCKVSFSALNVSNSEIIIKSSDFRDANNNVINIMDVINARVEIK